MSHRVGSIKNIRTIKALRGDELVIDLGREYQGELVAQMKKDHHQETFRQFDIKDNRYLILSREKTQDYYTQNKQFPIETIEGKWYFDVEITIEGKTRTIYTGTIFFENDITNSGGLEVLDPNIISINLDGGFSDSIPLIGKDLDAGGSQLVTYNLDGGNSNS
ncbi:structural protein [Cellulophaga phage phi19:2]|uniref:Structural protein n=3 Tax=Cellulophaga phage phiST TaxID=756282 RepID=M4SPV2_9CAUD|nr:virion structural protein [Cellulophaga phage phiST]AGH56776.1 hypothetical protein CGPG_00078 [Cellulophaga phage phiST]AGO47168.1 structural protein [Cellulophaga phage phiST]AGO48664.1 structural protein [Cellulophaga phage phi19:2]AGO49034.1 structural protein [Cellulophaga phage phi13:1]